MNKELIFEKTKKALLWMSLSNEPFVVLYAIIPFVIRKDLNASLIHLSILASLKPVLSIFSFYWSANLTRHKYRLRSNLMGAWLFARLPFIFVPWITNIWYILFCSACYELLKRSGNPALMEILKINLPKKLRERIYNLCFVLSFLESILLGVILIALLNNDFFSWQRLFGITALISLTSILAQAQVPLPEISVESCPEKQKVSDRITVPWKDAFSLLKSQPSFFRFQCGFMIGGIGLMIASPSLSLYCVDLLDLSHAEITIGRSILMGVGVTFSSYFWKEMISGEKIDRMLRNILFGFFLYLFCLYLGFIHTTFFYLAFFLYGLAQAGSHLLWNLSGPLFSGEDDSSQFSRVNILMVGLRGATIPALGGVLCYYFGPGAMVMLGSGICLVGAFYMNFVEKRNLATT